MGDGDAVDGEAEGGVDWCGGGGEGGFEAALGFGYGAVWGEIVSLRWEKGRRGRTL